MEKKNPKKILVPSVLEGSVLEDVSMFDEWFRSFPATPAWMAGRRAELVGKAGVDGEKYLHWASLGR